MYRALLPEPFTREVPVEEKATCASCAMCPESASNVVESFDGANNLFRPDTKCCTYHPKLPNYLVGALLSDESPALAEGRRRMLGRIESKVAIDPQWVKPPARYALLYRNAHDAFGRASALRCPFFHEGGCSIWPYREAVCSTFFCKHVSGLDGRKLWMSAKTYLSLIEIQLTRYVLMELLPDYLARGRDKPEPEGRLGAGELDEAPPSPEVHRARWGEWAGREVELYRRSFEIVRALSAADVERILGLDGTVELLRLERLHARATRPGVPARAKFNPRATVKWLPDGSVGLGAYSEYEAIALPGPAYGLLVQFTGREPTETVRARLREKEQADLADELLISLYQQRILVDADDPDA
jgi:Fe-S-cluster containining protein